MKNSIQTIYRSFYILLAAFALSDAVMGQSVPPSLDQNWVRTETVIVDNVSSEAAIANLPIGQKGVNYQYFDAFGRPLQNVSVGSGPSGKDIVQPVEYDAFGRQTKSYLPYTTSGNGAFQSSWTTQQPTFYNGSILGIANESRPYTENMYTNNVVTKSFGVGNQWYTDDKYAKGEFKVNGSSQVRYWQIKDGVPISYDYWPSSTLTINEIKDQEGNISKTYTDSRGLTILKSSGGISTYYVYDDYGNIRFILTPESVIDMPEAVTGSMEYISSSTSKSAYENKSYVFGPDGSVELTPGFTFFASGSATFSITLGAQPQGVLEDFVFQFEHDDQQRLIKEKAPGADWVYYVYDQWDRPVLSQDGVQRTNNEWAFVKYDFWNRPVLSGIYNTAKSHQTLINDAEASNVRYETRNTSERGYSLNASFPTIADGDLLSITYYDNYDYKTNSNWEREGNSFDLSLPSGFTGTQAPNTLDLTTGSKVKILGSNTWLNSVIYYDDDFRPLQVITENHLGGRDIATTEYDTKGLVEKALSRHENGSTTLEILEDYVYDNVGRLLEAYHTTDGGERILMTAVTYNELGEVIEKNVHKVASQNKFLQSVDYRTNSRGWLTSINSSDLAEVEANAYDDLFGMEMAYNTETYQVNNTAASKYYNGNVSVIKWQTNNLHDAPKERAFAYTYDNRYQLETARYGAKNSTGSNFNQENGHYNVNNLAYDNNGNIKTLSRSGIWGGSSATTIDDLTYQYDGNKVKSVEDQGSTAGFTNNVVGLATEYDYDENGSLKYDLNKLVVDITYNDLGLVDYVEFDNHVKVYSTYDAAGILFSKEVKEGTTTKYKADYVGGIVYEDGDISFVHTAEGRVIAEGNDWNYEYYHTDHLGNIRMMYGYFKETDVYKATMETGKASEEDQYFTNMNTRKSGNNIPNHTLPDAKDPLPSYVAELNPVGGSAIGPALMIPVSTGDQIDMEVYARYDDAIGSNTNLIADLASAITSAFGLVGSGGTETAFNAINNTMPGLASSIPSTDGNGSPKAYFNYVLFDNNYVQQQFGFLAVSDQASGSFEKLALTVDMTSLSDGYLYIYPANESMANVAVWFDDLKVVHTKNNNALQVVSSKDYYPFGMKIAGTEYWNEAKKTYKYGYQGIYAQEDSVTQWNTFALRTYDPALGRFISTDPAGQFMSPYLGMANNPVNYVDPSGAVAGWIASAAHTIFGAALSGAHSAHENGGDPWNGALLGAFSGSLKYGKGYISSQLSGIAGTNQFLRSIINVGSNTILGSGIGNDFSLDALGRAAIGNTISESLINLKIDRIVANSYEYRLHKSGILLPEATAEYDTKSGEIKDMEFPDHWGETDYFLNPIIAEARDAMNKAGGFIFDAAMIIAPVPKLGIIAKAVRSLRGASATAKGSSRAFFSGAGTEARAIGEGFQTLGQTRAGQNLMKLTKGMDYYPGSQAYNMWARLSATYAKGIPKGSSVNVFLKNPSPTGIWNAVEKPILQQRGINIIYR